MTEKLIDKGSVNKKKRAEQLQKDEEDIKKMEDELLAKYREDNPEETQEEEPTPTEDEVPEDEPATEEPAESEETSEGETEDQDEEEDNLSAEEKTFKQRYGDLRRHMEQKRKAWESEKKSLLNRSTAELSKASEDDVKTWVNDHPELAAVINGMADKIADTKLKEVQESFKELDEQRWELSREKAEAKISAKHSDFKTLRNDDKFHAWAKKQPKVIQDALYDNSDDPDSVIRVIDMYKIDTKSKKIVDNKSDKEAMKATTKGGQGKASPSTKASTEWSESRVSKLSDKEYAKFAAEIDEAVQSGKFKFDLAG